MDWGRIHFRPDAPFFGVEDFAATLYRHLGVDAERGSVTGPGRRPVPLLQQSRAAPGTHGGGLNGRLPWAR